MALNSGALNTHAINAEAGFVSATGSVSISIVQIVGSLASTSIDVVQEVGSQASSSITLNQIVELHATGSASYDIEQIVAAQASTSINLEQVVVNLAATADFYAKNGYEPRVYLAGRRVSDDELHGMIDIYFQENQAPQASFTLIPPRGTQDIRSYRGKSVSIYIRDSTGTIKCFTGTVNEPDVAIIDQKITLNCSLDIEQKVEQLSQSFINSIGLYNNKVFSKAKTKEQELRDRISTVAKTVDWTPCGNIQINDIAPKSTADYTLGNSVIRRKNLQYKFSSRQRYTNKIEITCNYSFKRLHHHERSYYLDDNIGNFCDFAVNAKTPLTRSLVVNALQGMGWTINNLQFTDFFTAGVYRCTETPVIFIPNVCSKQVNQSETIEINGVPQAEVTDSKCANGSGNWCQEATWVASKQFAQVINQKYILTVQAPQSIASYGEKKKEDSFTLADSYDASDWENTQGYNSSAPSGFSKTGTQNLNFWVDARKDVGTFSQCINIILNKAKSDILKSHRDDVVTFKRSLWPQVQLKHTIELDSNRIDCKGKVKSYRHVINCETGEAYTVVDLVFSRSEGSASDSSLGLPSMSLSSIQPSYPSTLIVLPSQHGVNIEDAAAPLGFYGNKISAANGNGSLTTFPVALSITQPKVNDQLRLSKDISDSTSFNVAIPNDTLTIYFPDDNYS